MFKKNSVYFLTAAIFTVHLLAGQGLAGEADTAPVLKCELLKDFPHDIKAFTQGFLYHNGYFYESTGRHGQSAVRRVIPESGRVKNEIRLNSRLFGEGLCLWEDTFLQLTWKTGDCYIYDAESLARNGVFKYKGQGWGLTTDGQFLFHSNGSSVISIRDPHDFEKISELRVTDGGRKVYRINELEYVSGLILCNIWQKDLIAAVDSRNGKVRFWLDISALRPLAGTKAEAANGIAWDKKDKRLFITGKYWDKVFQIRLPEPLRATSYK